MWGDSERPRRSRPVAKAYLPIPRPRLGLPGPCPVQDTLTTHMVVLLSPQKKSRNETYGEGSGVEILENRPYTDGPGGSGQYTHKVYHVGMHIPGWFRSILPKAALRVVEESWNAYPYTRTRCAGLRPSSASIWWKETTDPGVRPPSGLSPVHSRGY